MGTWGYGIFENDITMDIRDYFEELKFKDNNLNEVTRIILHLFDDVVNDYDEGPLVYFALAELQIENGFLDHVIKMKCIEYLNNKTSLNIWKKSGIKSFLKRRKVLKILRNRLIKFKNITTYEYENDNKLYSEYDPLKFTVYELVDENLNVRYVGSTSYYEKRKKLMETIFQYLKVK